MTPFELKVLRACICDDLHRLAANRRLQIYAPSTETAMPCWRAGVLHHLKYTPNQFQLAMNANAPYSYALWAALRAGKVRYLPRLRVLEYEGYTVRGGRTRAIWRRIPLSQPATPG